MTKMAMDLIFRTEKKKPKLRFLQFLPKSLRAMSALAILLNIVGIGIALIFYSGLQKQIPLFYSLPNDQQLVNKQFLFILPAVASLINALHLLIAYLQKNIEESILKMFVQITLLLQILALAILLRIIIIVT